MNYGTKMGFRWNISAQRLSALLAWILALYPYLLPVSLICTPRLIDTLTGCTLDTLCISAISLMHPFSFINLAVQPFYHGDKSEKAQTPFHLR